MIANRNPNGTYTTGQVQDRIITPTGGVKEYITITNPGAASTTTASSSTDSSVASSPSFDSILTSLFTGNNLYITVGVIAVAVVILVVIYKRK